MHDASESLDHQTYRRGRLVAVVEPRGKRSCVSAALVVLDGVARAGELSEPGTLPGGLGARCGRPLTACEAANGSVTVVEDRDRVIPGWHELTWDHVVDFLGR